MATDTTSTSCCPSCGWSSTWNGRTCTQCEYGSEPVAAPVGTADQCPKCNWTYGWNGRTCNHCKYVAPIRQVIRRANQASDVADLYTAMTTSSSNSAPAMAAPVLLVAAPGMMPDAIGAGGFVGDSLASGVADVPVDDIDFDDVVAVVFDVVGSIFKGLFG